MIRSLLLLVTIIMLSLPCAAVCIPHAMLTGDATLLYNVSQWIVRTAFKLAGIRVAVEGRDRIPQNTACIFMANHISNLDPPVLVPNLPGRTSIFLKKSLMKIPILGYGMKLGEFIPVSRDGSVESAKESMGKAGEVLKKGLHITTFVEGTRSKDGRMLPFKKGPFFLAMESNAPCIPVSIYGTESMMAKGSARVLAGTAHIVFHDPVYPSDCANREELMQRVRVAMASGLPEWMRT